jgi:hypothetical protein
MVSTWRSTALPLTEVASMVNESSLLAPRVASGQRSLRHATEKALGWR